MKSGIVVSQEGYLLEYPVDHAGSIGAVLLPEAIELLNVSPENIVDSETHAQELKSIVTEASRDTVGVVSTYNLDSKPRSLGEPLVLERSSPSELLMGWRSTITSISQQEKKIAFINSHPWVSDKDTEMEKDGDWKKISDKDSNTYKIVWQPYETRPLSNRPGMSMTFLENDAGYNDILFAVNPPEATGLADANTDTLKVAFALPKDISKELQITISNNPRMAQEIALAVAEEVGVSADNWKAIINALGADTPQTKLFVTGYGANGEKISDETYDAGGRGALEVRPLPKLTYAKPLQQATAQGTNAHAITVPRTESGTAIINIPINKLPH